ncbi:Inhibitor of growth protein, partial [Operophtera brumata]
SCLEVTTNGTANKKEPTPPPESTREREREREKEKETPVAAPTQHSTPAPPERTEKEKEKVDKDKSGGMFLLGDDEHLIDIGERDGQSARVALAPRRAWRRTARTRASETARGTRTPLPTRKVSLLCTTYIQSARTTTGVATDVADSSERDSERHAHTTTNKKGKKKKRKARQTTQRSETPPEETDAIDPDEPRYCLCDQISFGEMILCDNDLCPIEWFHFSCVSLTTKPKGKWFCPKCRGDRPNIMKPKGQFLKELE